MRALVIVVAIALAAVTLGVIGIWRAIYRRRREHAEMRAWVREEIRRGGRMA